jgi:hypothetical protein
MAQGKEVDDKPSLRYITLLREGARTHGLPNVAFLRKRFEAMSASHCYYGMEFAERRANIAEWPPLIVDGRRDEESFAATRIITGTDVDYGALAHLLIKHLSAQSGVSVHYKRRVVSLDREQNGAWRVGMEDDDTQERHAVSSKSSSSAPVAAPSSCSRSRASPKAVAMSASRSAESGSGVTIVQ